MSYGIKIGREEKIILSEMENLDDSILSINHESSYFIGPKDYCEEKEPKIDTMFYDSYCKGISNQLLKLNDILKNEDK